MINDDECDVRMPMSVDDGFNQQYGPAEPAESTTDFLVLSTVTPVVRLYTQIKRTLKSRNVTADVLGTYDGYFKNVMATFPEPFPIYSQAHLDPRFLFAACTLQSARFTLYRHNLSPACRPEDRRDAIDRCASVGRDTAQYIQRSMQQSMPAEHSPDHMVAWTAQLRTMAPAFLCSHLWRCALILCLRMDYAPALTLVHASASIGDLRKNNIACGRNLAFFLDNLTGRIRAGATKASLETDEEMLAYASGDLQGCEGESWVWTEFQPGTNVREELANGYETNATGTHTQTTLTERETYEWGGWEHIQRTLTQLMNDQHSLPQAQQQPYPPITPSYPPPSHTPNQQIAPQPLQAIRPSPSPTGLGSTSSRISIKDIM